MVAAPVYSHLTYDIVDGDTVTVDRPDILIVEGLNVLLPGRRSRDGRPTAFVSDFFDFSIYLDAAEDDLQRWYIERFMGLRQTSFRDPRSYFGKYADLDDAAAMARAAQIWRDINLANLHENVLPTRARAGLILTKGTDHAIADVALRKL